MDKLDKKLYNKETYIKSLDELMDNINTIAEKCNPDIKEIIALIRLQFDIVTAAYNCSKE